MQSVIRGGFVTLIAIALSFLAGCGGHGSEYVGKWVNVKNDKTILEIARNGESFMIRETTPNLFTGKVGTTSVPALLKDGVLTVQVGWSSVSFALDKSTGNLTNGLAEYKRAD
ncbi:hypothetical protein ACR2R6_23380 (plasmid) [Methylocaldum gracile subsp. desertum]|uniref:hypothetical protein n=1 Tax=Methylocaldum sp. GT1BW TaxID=3438964 RepID=UPI003DA0EA58